MRNAQRLLSGASAVVHLRITQVAGSAPREVGAEMFVTASDSAGTIGGGQAEWQALARARAMLAGGERQATLMLALGPELGQCCGGRLCVEFKRLSQEDRAAHLARLERAERPLLMILGAGHVGRALARVAQTMPWQVVLVDPRATELAKAPDGIATRLTPLPEIEVENAPPQSAFVVTTHDHGLDFLLTLAVLRRGDFAYAGLIGSATKRARFQRFARETDNFNEFSRLTCPIGAAGLGDKRPEVIALMTAQEIFAAFRDMQTAPLSLRAQI